MVSIMSSKCFQLCSLVAVIIFLSLTYYDDRIYGRFDHVINYHHDFPPTSESSELDSRVSRELRSIVPPTESTNPTKRNTRNKKVQIKKKSLSKVAQEKRLRDSKLQRNEPNGQKRQSKYEKQRKESTNSQGNSISTDISNFREASVTKPSTRKVKRKSASSNRTQVGCKMRKSSTSPSALYINDLQGKSFRSHRSFVLVCDQKPSQLKYQHHIYPQIISHSFSRKCPEVYDYQNHAHQAEHMCSTTKQIKACIFTLSNVVLSVCGGLVDHKTRLPYNFYHSSFGKEAINGSFVNQQWQSYYLDNAILGRNRIPAVMKTYEYVIPARMAFDQHFGHLSHQSFPFIGHAYAFIDPSILSQAYWHCSIFTAAILILLDIPEEKLLTQTVFQKRDKQEPILVRNLIYPYVPRWSPPQTSSFHGISNNISKIFTKNLLAKCSNESIETAIDSKRTILYLSRSPGQTRQVLNQDSIIKSLQNYLNHEMYEFIVVNNTKEYKSIDQLHQAWCRSALHFSRAKVLIGPHGSSFSNLVTCPDDVHFVEFNLFPDDPKYSSKAIKVSHARSSLLAAAWEKGYTGKYFTIEPSLMSDQDFYNNDIRVSEYELIEILKHIHHMEGNVLASNVDLTINPFPFEQHKLMPVKSKSKVAERNRTKSSRYKRPTRKHVPSKRDAKTKKKSDSLFKVFG